MDRKWIWIGYAYGSILSKIIAVRVAKPGPGKNYCCEMMAEPGSGGKKIQNLDQVKLIAVTGWQKPGPGEEARAMMRRSQCSSFQQFDN